MANELELKAVVQDAAVLRKALHRAGATLTFRGMMRDRRLDCGGELVAREEVLRLRSYQPESGAGHCVITWKGPTSVTASGYKQREEVECGALDGDAALAIFLALGYQVVHAIDRFVELWDHPDATARLEWYPRMDLLLEIEGAPEGMERLIAAIGVDRAACLPDALNDFAARYAARSCQRAIWAEADLAGSTPGWVNA